MSRLQLIGFITATTHEVASRLKANYSQLYNINNGLLNIEIFNENGTRSFVIDLLNDDNLSENVSSIASQIQSTEL